MNKSDENLEVLTLLLFIVTIFSIVVNVMQNNTIKAFKQQAIEQECAHYNSVDGKFEWLRKDK